MHITMLCILPWESNSATAFQMKLRKKNLEFRNFMEKIANLQCQVMVWNCFFIITREINTCYIKTCLH